jgi:hypothetical protein
MEKQYLTVEEAVKTLKSMGICVGRSVVRSLIIQKRLPVLVLGRRQFIQISDLKECLKKLAAESGAINFGILLSWFGLGLILAAFWAVASWAVLGFIGAL